MPRLATSLLEVGAFWNNRVRLAAPGVEVFASVFKAVLAFTHMPCTYGIECREHVGGPVQ